MTPQKKYQTAIENGQLRADEMQSSAVGQLDTLYHKLVKQESASKRFLSSLLPHKIENRGLYLWGGTGRGKTHLMDAVGLALQRSTGRNLTYTLGAGRGELWSSVWDILLIN